MKTLFVLIVMAAIFMTALVPVVSGESLIAIPSELLANQGVAIDWQTGRILNTTTFDVAYTKPKESWPTWANDIWDGWRIRAGFAYDSNSADNGILEISRRIGTLGKYVPINFPLLDKITIDFVPAGLKVERFTSGGKLNWGGYSGITYLKGSLKL